MDRQSLEAEISRLIDSAWAADIPAPADFDEAAYLAAWPDVAAAMRRGEIKSAFVHYVLIGHREGRARPTRIESR